MNDVCNVLINHFSKLPLFSVENYSSSSSSI